MKELNKIQCLNCRRKRDLSYSPKTKLFYIGFIWFFLIFAFPVLGLPFVGFFLWAIFKGKKLCCSTCKSENVVPFHLWQKAEQDL